MLLGMPSRLTSTLSGWTTVLTSITSIASFAWAVASTLALFISVLQPQWVPTSAQTMTMSFAVVLLWVFLSCSRLENISWLVQCNGKSCRSANGELSNRAIH